MTLSPGCKRQKQSGLAAGRHLFFFIWSSDFSQSLFFSSDKIESQRYVKKNFCKSLLWDIFSIVSCQNIRAEIKENRNETRVILLYWLWSVHFSGTGYVTYWVCPNSPADSSLVLKEQHTGRLPIKQQWCITCPTRSPQNHAVSPRWQSRAAHSWIANYRKPKPQTGPELCEETGVAAEFQPLRIFLLRAGLCHSLQRPNSHSAAPVLRSCFHDLQC